MEVRIAELKDADFLYETLKQVNKVHTDIRPDLFGEKLTKYDKNQVKELIENEKYLIFIAEEDSELYGYIICYTEDFYGKKTMYIDDLCVNNTKRHSGAGRALYKYVKDYSKRQGCYNVTLHVWNGNDGAENFYKEMGLKPLYTCMEEIL